MAGEQGFLYEKKINNLIYKGGLIDARYGGAGSDSNAPDAWFEYQGVKYKLEVKLDLKADFGQGSLVYDVKSKKWDLGGATTPSGEAMRNFLEGIQVPKMVNRVWGPKGAPRKFTVPLDRYRKEDVTADYRRFTDQKISVASDAIANYYASKKTYYIQIGDGHGLYYMGKDVAKLGCKEFNPTTTLRIRLKRGGSLPIYNYRFSTALLASKLQESTVDLENPKDIQALAARSKD